jgi:hypothetical protein
MNIQFSFLFIHKNSNSAVIDGRTEYVSTYLLEHSNVNICIYWYVFVSYFFNNYAILRQ